jgi:hypothetical protein
MPHPKLVAEVAHDNIVRFIGMLEIEANDGKRSLLQRMILTETDRLNDDKERRDAIDHQLEHVAGKIADRIKEANGTVLTGDAKDKFDTLTCNLFMTYGALSYRRRSIRH